MNVRISLFALLGLATLTGGCISEADGNASAAQADDSGAPETPPEDSGTDTTPPATDDAAYTFDDGVLTLDRDFNPYSGLTIGFFCDGCGTEDGWSRAVATVPETDGGDLEVNLGRYGAGTDTRWSLAVVDENLVPTQWLWESGEVGEELEEHDPLGLTIPVQECVGDVMVDKLDFCTQISGDSIMAGSCWGTYVPPADCTDSDNDGDGDPDTTPDDGNDDGEEDEDDGDDSGSGSNDLTREVCVNNVTGDFDLGYLLMGDSGDTSHWVSDNGSAAVVSSPLLTEGDSDGCATIELNYAGEQVKFNGWAENSTYWHEYFVGTGTSGYCSGTTCSVGKIYVDSTVDGDISSGAEQATISGMDLVWTD